MRRFLLLSLSLALPLAIACGDKDDTSSPEGDADADTDTDTDTDADGDADVGACSAWTGISRVGSTWSYAFADGDLSGTVDNEVTAYDPLVGTVGTESLSVLSTADYIITSTTTTEYLCDGDGYWITHQYTEYSMQMSGQDFDGWTEMTYDPPALLMPADMEVGTTWTTAYVGTTETSISGASDFSSTVQQEVTGAEQVTVPAGTWDTLLVEFTGDGEGFSNVARDVGQVKSNVTVLTSFNP
ncbi:MAG: hypothetical protein ABIO70_37145 [Pseudomonadota bacterium]